MDQDTSALNPAMSIGSLTPQLNPLEIVFSIPNVVMADNVTL